MNKMNEGEIAGEGWGVNIYFEKSERKTREGRAT